MNDKTIDQLLTEIKAQKERIAELQTAEAKPHLGNDVYKKQAHALGERVKELSCLYGILSLVETPGIPLADILQECVKLLPPAWQYPQITCARITYKDQEHKTENFRETKWKLASEIKIEGKRAGSVEVFYLEKQPKDYEGPFLKEERALIDAVAECLGDVCVRKQAEVVIRESQERLNKLIESLPIGISVSTPKGNVPLVNRALWNIFGYDSKEDFLKVPAAAHYYNQNDRKIFIEAHKKGLVEGLEIRYKRKDGTMFWGSVTSTTLIFGNKKPEFINVFEDVTERRQSQEEINLLLKLTQGIIKTPDFHSAIEFVLRSVCETTNWAYGEAWIPGEDDAAALECFPVWYSSSQDKMKKFRQVSEEIRFPANTGLPGRVWSSRIHEWIPDISISSKKIFLRVKVAAKTGFKAALGVPIIAGENFLGVLVFFDFRTYQEDNHQVELVTAVAAQLGEVIQRKYAENALLESEARLKKAEHMAQMGYWELDLVKDTLLWSDEVYRIFGIKPQEFRATYEAFLDNIHPDDRQFVNKAYTDSLKDRTAYDIVHRLMLKDGTLKYVNEQCKTIFDENGTPLRSMGTIQDITEIKQAEERINHLNLVLSAIRNVNQLIIREKDRDDLIQQACAALVETGGYATAWIALFDASGGFLISAEAGFGKSFKTLLAQLKRDDPPACARSALSIAGLVEIVDPLSTCAGCPLTGIYSDKGRMAIWLEHDGEVYGVLAVSILAKFLVDEKEHALLQEIAADIAFALYSIKLEEKIKQSVQNLQEKAEYQKTIFETTSLATTIIKEDTTLSMVNKEFVKLSGYSKVELEGKMSWTVFVAAEDLKRMQEYHHQRRIDPDNTLKQYEFRFINREGFARDILLRATLIPGTKQSVASLLDITERKTFTQELQQERDKAQKYLNIAEVMIVALNSEGEITLVNQKGTSILGYQIEDLTGKNWFSACIPASVREETKKIFDEFMAGGVALGDHFEQTVITKGGEERIIDWHSTPLWEWDGEVKHRIGSLSSGEDITDRVAAEQAIRQEQEKSQKYLDVAGVMFIALNKKGEITLINQKGCQILGYQEDELIGLNWFETCLPERNRKEVKKVFKQIIAGDIKLVEFYENPILTRSGEERIIAWHNAVLKDEKGHIIGTLASGENVTERVRVEQLLNALNRATVTMGTAQTQQEIFNIVSEELKQLDISCMLFPLDETQDKLFIKYLSYESALLNAAEKLAGIKLQGFSFPIKAVDIFREVVREKNTLITDNPEQALQQTIPKLSKKIATKIIKTLHVQKMISAPLVIEDQVIGVFSIQSNTLTREDVPSATAFADQLSSALNKIELLQNLRKIVKGTIHTIAATVEARDPYTAGHQSRVADLAAAIASEMHLSKDQVEGIKMAGIIHDLGKINVPAEILSKPGKISELEYKIIQTHPQVGFDLLKKIEFPWPIAEMVLQHHEKMDGSGYPQGLNGDEIMLEARILAVADIVEAMSSHRPYRPAFGIEKALAQIKKDKGTLLDPKVVEACLKIFKGGYTLPKN